MSRSHSLGRPDSPVVLQARGVGQTIVKFTGADFIAGGKAKVETGVGEIVLVSGHYTLTHGARIRLVENAAVEGGRPR